MGVILSLRRIYPATPTLGTRSWIDPSVARPCGEASLRAERMGSSLRMTYPPEFLGSILARSMRAQISIVWALNEQLASAAEKYRDTGCRPAGASGPSGPG